LPPLFYTGYSYRCCCSVVLWVPAPSDSGTRGGHFWIMLGIDTRKIGLELRQALEAIGIYPDRIVVRIEPVYGQTYVRVIAVVGDQGVDVHSPAEGWPPAASTARSLRWVLQHGDRAPLNGTVEQWLSRHSPRCAKRSTCFRRLPSSMPRT